MNLVASLVCHNEKQRYIEQSIPALAEFCDDIRVLDDRSDDGTCEWLCEQDSVSLSINDGPPMFEHEGQARNLLLDWTLEAQPTHVLAIDADEFISDPQALRGAAESTTTPIFTLEMTEVWQATKEMLWVRYDGGWRSSKVPVLYRPPERRDGSWKILNRPLACGREPVAIRRRLGEAQHLPVKLLHFGWANERQRQARYDRYVEADGGKYHTSRHLLSIMWPPTKVMLRPLPWPDALISRRTAILDRVNA